MGVPVEQVVLLGLGCHPHARVSDPGCCRVGGCLLLAHAGPGWGGLAGGDEEGTPGRAGSLGGQLRSCDFYFRETAGAAGCPDPTGPEAGSRVPLCPAGDRAVPLYLRVSDPGVKKKKMNLTAASQRALLVYEHSPNLKEAGAATLS